MEEMETLNGSCSYEQTADKNIDLTTGTSLKSSLASVVRSSITKHPSQKSNSVSISKNEDYSTELCEEDIDEDCTRRNVADFQKNYLELGQWPEVPVPKFQAFKVKYRNMKQKLGECKIKKEKAEARLKKFENGEIQCKNCEVLKGKNAKTKLALEQAVQLSNLLLKEVKRMELASGDVSF